jgi:hypothetical protein
MMDFVFDIATLTGGLFAAMLVLLETGRRLGLRRLAEDSEAARARFGVVEGAIFALMGLLIAFTFSGAASRFDLRRHLVVEEANAIGTAYLRLDLLPASIQPPLRDCFRHYVEARLDAYRKLPDIVAAKLGLAHATQLQGQIWSQAVAACQEAPHSATMLLLPALNAMIDITTTRSVAAQSHPPLVIFAMLCVLALASSLLAGYSMAGGQLRNCWIHMLVFAVIMAVTVYVILDLEYPRLGLIRVDAVDQVLVDLRESMK